MPSDLMVNHVVKLLNMNKTRKYLFPLFQFSLFCLEFLLLLTQILHLKNEPFLYTE